MNEDMEIKENQKMECAEDEGKPRSFRGVVIAAALIMVLGVGGTWALGETPHEENMAPARHIATASEAEKKPSLSEKKHEDAPLAEKKDEQPDSSTEKKTDVSVSKPSAPKKTPVSDKTATQSVRPQAAEGKPASNSKKWGVVKKAWDEKIVVQDAYDETVVVRPAWDEDKLVREAWEETVDHPAEYGIEKVKVGVLYICDTCGFSSKDIDAFGSHLASYGHIGWTKPVYEERKVLVKEAWTERVLHPAEYQTIYHPAETKTVHHDAVYKTVHHKAEYGWI